MESDDFFKAVAANHRKIVPFGKYKGQPIEVLQQDQGYMDWLAGQEGIRRQYPWIFSLTVNTGVEPAETPEHNRYQILFFDSDNNLAADVFDTVRPGLRLARADYVKANIDSFKRDGYSDATIASLTDLRIESEVSVFIEAGDGYVRRYRENYKNRLQKSGAADIHLEFDSTIVRIEIKPVMGDDYPAVLRQMKNSVCDVLYLVEYTGVGATLDQVRRMFAASDIRILMHSDFWE